MMRSNFNTMPILKDQPQPPRQIDRIDEAAAIEGKAIMLLGRISRRVYGRDCDRRRDIQLIGRAR